MIKNKEKLKRISIAGISFCFMISIAGYINYKYIQVNRSFIFTI